jgi:hypothetical protein
MMTVGFGDDAQLFGVSPIARRRFHLQCHL